MEPPPDLDVPCQQDRWYCPTCHETKRHDIAAFEKHKIECKEAATRAEALVTSWNASAATDPADADLLDELKRVHGAMSREERYKRRAVFAENSTQPIAVEVPAAASRLLAASLDDDLPLDDRDESEVPPAPHSTRLEEYTALKGLGGAHYPFQSRADALWWLATFKIFNDGARSSMRSMQLLSDVATYIASSLNEKDVNLGRAQRAAEECFLVGHEFKRVELGSANGYILLQDMDAILDELAYYYGDRMHTKFQMVGNTSGERVYRAPWNCDLWLDASSQYVDTFAISIFADSATVRGRKGDSLHPVIVTPLGVEPDECKYAVHVLGYIPAATQKVVAYNAIWRHVARADIQREFVFSSGTRKVLSVRVMQLLMDIPEATAALCLYGRSCVRCTFNTANPAAPVEERSATRARNKCDRWLYLARYTPSSRSEEIRTIRAETQAEGMHFFAAPDQKGVHYAYKLTSDLNHCVRGIGHLVELGVFLRHLRMITGEITRLDCADVAAQQGATPARSWRTIVVERVNRLASAQRWFAGVRMPSHDWFTLVMRGKLTAYEVTSLAPLLLIALSGLPVLKEYASDLREALCTFSFVYASDAVERELTAWQHECDNYVDAMDTPRMKSAQLTEDKAIEMGKQAKAAAKAAKAAKGTKGKPAANAGNATTVASPNVTDSVTDDVEPVKLHSVRHLPSMVRELGVLKYNDEMPRERLHQPPKSQAKNFKSGQFDKAMGKRVRDWGFFSSSFFSFLNTTTHCPLHQSILSARAFNDWALVSLWDDFMAWRSCRHPFRRAPTPHVELSDAESDFSEDSDNDDNNRGNDYDDEDTVAYNADANIHAAQSHERVSGLIDQRELVAPARREALEAMASAMRYRAPHVYVEHAKVDFYRHFIFAASRDHPSLSVASATRPANAVLLKALPSQYPEQGRVELRPGQQPWADVVSIVSGSEAGIWIVVRPFVQHHGSIGVIDDVSSTPIVARSCDSPLIAVRSDSIVAPIHVVPYLPPIVSIVDRSEARIDPRTDPLHGGRTPQESIRINWWIFRSNCKYPVRVRDQQLGLRGYNKLAK